MGIRVAVTLSGISPSTFAATKSAQLASSLASLLGVPAAWLNIAVAVPSMRGLQAVGDATTVTITIPASDPAAAASKLQSAISSGAVASMLSQLGLTLTNYSIAVSTYSTAPTAASPSPVLAAPSLAPSAPTIGTSGGSSSSSSNVGAIVGEPRWLGRGWPGLS